MHFDDRIVDRDHRLTDRVHYSYYN